MNCRDCRMPCQPSWLYQCTIFPRASENCRGRAEFYCLKIQHGERIRREIQKKNLPRQERLVSVMLLCILYMKDKKYLLGNDAPWAAVAASQLHRPQLGLFGGLKAKSRHDLAEVMIEQRLTRHGNRCPCIIHRPRRGSVTRR